MGACGQHRADIGQITNGAHKQAVAGVANRRVMPSFRAFPNIALRSAAGAHRTEEAALSSRKRERTLWLLGRPPVATRTASCSKPRQVPWTGKKCPLRLSCACAPTHGVRCEMLISC